VNTVSRLYLRYTAPAIVLLCALALAVLWNAPLFGRTVVPYDFQTADFPAFVDAIRAARFDPFSVYNPFNDAGQITTNLLAFFDPLGWVTAVGRQFPAYSALELYYFAHLMLIPVGLLLVAWASEVPRERWWAIVPISFVAFAMGPTLKYLQQANSLVALGYLVLLFGALEAFRRTGALWACLVAGLALAYTTEHWIYASIFVPIPLAAYALANGKELFATRRRVAYAACGVLVALVVMLPAALLDVKIDQTIEVARNLEQLSELVPSDTASLLGAPSYVLPLVALPAALVALVLAAFRRATPFERRVYGVALIVLVLYGFDGLTPFAAAFRHVYPPAEFIRRPYAAWYVIIPFLLFLSVRTLGAWSPRAIQLGTILSAVAVALAAAQTTHWHAVAVVAATLAVTFWRPTLPIVMGAMVVQWGVIDWLPFERSAWHPQPLEARAAYFAPYETLRPILPFEASRSADAYRVANIGLPAEFGPYAGAFAVYNVAADYNTFIPHELVRELGTDQLHGTVLPTYFTTHPDALGGAPWRRLAVRYYLFGPETFAALPRAAFAKPGLKVSELRSYWRVVEDTRAAPFVAAIADDGKSEAVDAAMTRDSFTLTVPARAATVRFAQNYDPWWRARDASGADVSGAVRDDGGQLALAASALRGRSVTLRFTDRKVTLALALTLAVQVVIGLYLAALAVRALLRLPLRRRAAAGAPS
jgi:hypothetical protein